MSSLLDEFVALRKHLAENFIENGILEKNKLTEGNMVSLRLKWAFSATAFMEAAQYCSIYFGGQLWISNLLKSRSYFLFKTLMSLQIRGGLL